MTMNDEETNEILAAARDAKAQKEKADAAAREAAEDWSMTALGIGVGVGIGSAALAAALLYANRNKGRKDS